MCHLWLAIKMYLLAMGLQGACKLLAMGLQDVRNRLASALKLAYVLYLRCIIFGGCTHMLWTLTTTPGGGGGDKL